MILFKKSTELDQYLSKARNKGQHIGFAPTMGALHQGHMSLITASKAANALTIVSIFVNPAQFNDPKDYDKYPVTIEKDIAMLEANGCDVLFLPSVSEIYPNGTNTLPNYNLGHLETILEGKYRPGHFQGVCKVMHRLLSIVQATNLYMGQKDYQQCMVIKKLLQIIDMGTHLHTCPTLREPDGLAMSSRNMRLQPDERVQALAIYEMLIYIKQHFKNTSIVNLEEHARWYLQQKGFSSIDYVAIANAKDLSPVSEWNGTEPLVSLVAAFMNEVRLIDNMVLN
jgi:pantoate--beta-alanine ligase